MRVGTPQASFLTTMGDEVGEGSPLLGSRVATLRRAEVPILEGEESEGEAPRLGARLVAPRRSLVPRRGSRTSSLRFSLRLADPEPEPAGPDGGWGWVVTLAAFYCISILDGAAYTFGVFLDPLEVEMGGGHSRVSAIGSLMVATYAFTGPLASRLVNWWGTRRVAALGALISSLGLALGSFAKSLAHVMVAYSVFTGVGFGLMYLPAIVATANHFTKQRSLAVAICLCGAGFGTFTLSPLETWLTATYGWRWGFLSLSLLALLCLPAALTMTRVDRPYCPSSLPEVEEERRPEGLLARLVAAILDPALYASPALLLYLVVCLADVTATFSLFVPFQYVPSIAKARGLGPSQAAMLISATGVCSTAGRVIAGWLADRGWLHPITIASISTTLVLPPLFLLASCTSLPTFALCSSLYGLLTGAWIAVMSPIFVRILGLPLLSPAFSFLTAVRGLATLSGPPVAGALVDYYGDKLVAIYLAGLAMLAAALLFLAANLLSVRRDNRAVAEEPCL